MRQIGSLLCALCVGAAAVVSAQTPSAEADVFAQPLAGAASEPSLILVSRERSRLRV
jgi:hypothetical protein